MIHYCNCHLHKLIFSLEIERMTVASNYRTRGTAVAVGCARQVLVTHLPEINLPPIGPFNKLSNCVSHMQII